MARTARTSRDLMLAATETLLRERGLAGAGIQRVTARSGAPIGSLYHFFPGGKTQLVTEALRMHTDKAGALFRGILGDASMPLPDRIRRLFHTAAAGFDRTGADKSCAIGSVSLDLDARDDALGEVCREAFDGWIAAIADELPWTDAAARRSFAELLIAGLEGAFILGRARRNGAAFVTVGEWLALMLEHGPPPARVRAGARSSGRRPRKSSKRA